MKKYSFYFLLLCCSVNVSAQYYYNDIFVAQDNQKTFSKLAQYKISNITIKALDPDGSDAINFYLNQKVDLAERKITTFSKSVFSDASILETLFNKAFQPVSVFDSSDAASTRTLYNYDDSGLLQSMQSTSVQIEQRQNVANELRQYRYNDKGIPVEMIRTKDGQDTISVMLKPSENGLPGEEQWYKDGKKIETWYYYYDEQNNLTDIVRYNSAAGKMLPDYMFGYDANGNMTSKVTVQPVTGAFRIWQYTYNSRGLKTQEIALNKDRKEEGKLLYTYE